MSLVGRIMASDTARLSDRESWLTRALGARTRAGVAINENTALTIPAVFAAIGVTADPISTLPITVYERLPDGGKREAAEHPASHMLRLRPNRWCSSSIFRNAMQAHASGWGNGYAEIVRNGRGQAVELRLALPDRTRPEVVEDSDGETVVEYVTTTKGRQVRIPAEDMLHVAGMGFDGIQGYSPVSLFRESLGLTKATEDFGSSWFGAGSRSGGIIKLPKLISPEAEERMRRSWTQDNAGPENFHRVRILYEGAEYAPISIPPEDAQFLQTREFQIAEIARIWRVPLHMLQSNEKSTSWGSGIEQMSLGFVRYTLQPWVTRWEQELDYKLFIGAERGRYFVKFNMDALLRGTASERYKAYHTARATGWLRNSEIRELEDRDPVDGIDDVPMQGAAAMPRQEDA